MSNYLIHYGVKGMKWGVRRYQPYGKGGYNPKQKRKNQSSSKNNSKKQFDNLDDDHLIEALAKMSEKQYTKVVSKERMQKLEDSGILPPGYTQRLYEKPKKRSIEELVKSYEYKKASDADAEILATQYVGESDKDYYDRLDKLERSFSNTELSDLRKAGYKV